MSRRCDRFLRGGKRPKAIEVLFEEQAYVDVTPSSSYTRADAAEAKAMAAEIRAGAAAWFAEPERG